MVRAGRDGRTVRTRGLVTSLLGGRLPTVTRKGGRPRWLLTFPLVLAVLALFPGTVAVVGTVWALLRRRQDRAVAWTAAAVGLVVAVVLAGLVTSYAPSWGRVLRGDADRGDVLAVLGWSLILGLPVGPIWWRVDTWWRERQPMGGPTERAEREQVEAARRRAVVHLIQGAAYDPGRPEWVRRAAQLRAVPDHSTSGPLLGRKVAGDLDWPTGPRGALVLPSKGRRKPHTGVLGGTGSGKSEFVWRLVEHAVREKRPQQVIYLNAKQPGTDDAPSDRLEALAREAGRSVRVLRPGVSPYDPMRGTPQRVHQRLMATEEWSEPWYQHLGSVVLALALELAERRGSRPESLHELVSELLHGGLSDLAEDDDRAAEALRTIEKRDDGGLVTRLLDQALQLGGWIGPAAAGGWSWEDADVIAVDLPTGSDPGTAKMLLRLMLTDLAGWITEDRRPRLDGPAGGKGLGGPVPLLLVVEEVSAFDEDPIIGKRVTNAMERLRSSNGEMIVVAQDSMGLGDERAQRAVLTGATVVTGAQALTDEVERLAGLAGTRVAEEGSTAYQPGESGARGSVRAQHGYAVDPNALRQLGRGEVIVIDGGRWARVAVAMSSAGYAVDARRSTAPRPALDDGDQAITQGEQDALPSGEHGEGTEAD